MIQLPDIALVTTAWRRPYYLKQTLAAWERVRGYDRLRHHIIKAGKSDRLAGTMEVLDSFHDAHRHVFVDVDDGTLGPWRVNANAFIHALSDPSVSFAIMAEEDILPADDTLELMTWAASEFENDQEVLLVNAHSRCGQGWDGPNVKDDPDADPSVVRLIPYFNQWGWGTWRNRFDDVLLPQWDFDGTSGDLDKSGHDWNIHLRSMRGHVSVTPDASRTQHIGDREAWAANEWTLSWSKAASFREHRDSVTFRIG